MLKIHVQAKLRAFGITFGTLDDTKDVTPLIVALLSKIAPAFATVGAAALSALSSPHTLYNDHGVLVEIV
jgi:hypothetical protein